MRLTPWEEERLLIFTAGELARRRRERGLRLNAPEATALICDAMLEAARDGRGYEDVVAAGRAALGPDDVLDGVRELVEEIRLEVLLADGTRLIVLDDPVGVRPRDAAGPGAIIAPLRDPAAAPDDDRDRRRLEVRNTSRRVIRVSSHFPFDEVNPRLEFDRSAARGWHLDLPAGASERWSPGEEKTVEIVRYRGVRAMGDDEPGQ
jgi:urease subunit gamma/beta